MNNSKRILTANQVEGIESIVNYFSNSQIENGLTTGWTLGTVGTLTNAIPTGTPTFGSGASANLTLSASSSSPLRGTYSLSLVSSAATTVGNMVASDLLPIDAADQAKVLTYKFYYNVPSGSANGNFSGTSLNSFAVAAWDATNSVWLPVVGNFSMTQSSGSGVATGTFQTGPTTANVRFVIYNANASAGAITVNFDDFYLGPQTAPIGSVVTDWVSYTPTFTGLGTVTGVDFKSCRVGDSLHVKGKFTVGTGTATQAQISLGYSGFNANVVVDTTKVPPGTIIGSGGAAAASTTYFGLYPLAPTSNQSYINLALQTSTLNATTAQNGNIFGAGVTEVEFSVPIVGFSSQVQMSSDTDTRIVAARFKTSSARSITTASPTIIYETVDYDTHGAYNSSTGVYTIPVTGKYKVGGGFIAANGVSYTVNQGVELGVYKNGSIYGNFCGVRSQTTMSGYLEAFGATEIDCVAGDLITIRGYSDVSNTLLASQPNTNAVSIERLSGPSVIAASETVACSYGLTANQAVLINAVIKYDTKISDSHGMFSTSTGLATIPASGRYRISNTSQSTTGGYGCYIYKNGTTQVAYVSAATAANTFSGGSVTIPLIAGDTIAIYTNTAQTFAGSAAFVNTVSIERIGN